MALKRKVVHLTNKGLHLFDVKFKDITNTKE